MPTCPERDLQRIKLYEHFSMQISLKSEVAVHVTFLARGVTCLEETLFRARVPDGQANRPTLTALLSLPVDPGMYSLTFVFVRDTQQARGLK